jgi:hypothetical protein
MTSAYQEYHGLILAALEEYRNHLHIQMEDFPEEDHSARKRTLQEIRDCLKVLHGHARPFTVSGIYLDNDQPFSYNVVASNPLSAASKAAKTCSENCGEEIDYMDLSSYESELEAELDQCGGKIISITEGFSEDKSHLLPQ